jgi:hypothetical protein
LALLLGCSGLPPVLLVDRSRLMAAMADPLLSCLACAMSWSSSRVSASQQNSQACTSRDRPRVSRGGSPPVLAVVDGSELVSVEMGGRVTPADEVL